MGKRGFFCTTCIHLGEKNEGDDSKKSTLSCKAFPNGIPYEIYTERVLHYKRIEDQGNEFVYKSNSENQDIQKSRNLKIENFIKNKSQLELEVILLLKDLIEEENREFKLVAFWLSFQNKYDFFRRNSRKLIVYLILENNKIEEKEIYITSDFIRKAYDLLWIENVENHHSSMHIHLNKNGEGHIYYSIEHEYVSIISQFYRNREKDIFLRSKDDYEDVKKNILYKNCKSIDKIEILNKIKEFNEYSYYKIFLYFYIRKILITPTEVLIYMAEIRKNRKKNK